MDLTGWTELGWPSSEQSRTLVGASLTQKAKGSSYFAPLLLVTTVSHGVCAFDIEDRKCTSSWYAPRNTRLSSAAVYHPEAKSFFIVQDRRHVCMWQEKGEINGENATRALFDTDVLCVCVSAHLKTAVCVVCVDGSFHLCSHRHLKVMSSFKPPHLKSGNKVVHVQLLSPADGGARLVEVLDRGEKQSANRWHILVWNLSKPSCEPASFNVKPVQGSQKASILSCSVDPTCTTISILWSSHHWQLLRLPAPTDAVIPSAPVLTRRLDGFATGPGHQFLTHSFDGDFTLVVGPSQADPSQTVATMWDNQYGVLQGQGVVACDDDEQSSVGLSTRGASDAVVQALYSSEHGALVLLFSHKVMVCQCRPASLSLATSLGRLRPSATFLHTEEQSQSIHPPLSATANLQALISQLDVSAPGVSAEMDVEPELLEQWFGSDATAGSAGVVGEADELNALRQLTDPSKTPDHAKFREVLRAHIDRSQRPSSGKTEENTAEGRSWGVYLSPHFVAGVVERCLASHFWDSLVEVVRSNLVSAHTSPSLFAVATQHNQLELLEAVLMHVHDIPEEELVGLINYFIGLKDSQALKDYIGNRQVAPAVDLPLDFFLMLIVSAPRNDVFLLSFLKRLSLSEVIILLRFLVKWWSKHESLPPASLKIPDVRTPSFTQVLGWISLVTDSHFAELVLVDDCQQLVKTMQRLGRSQVKLLANLLELKAYLGHFLVGKPIPVTEVPDYSIDILDI
eukprot:gnl/Hemi2/11754_TR4034_c0_g1_i1.p1 gnl/Hemi2/11754_TR4034_c0_g1~~gnl/Hemi2/11754_TR4034_c0_g1_i1.p1  ORF type:complete len:739 (+),score=187.30 gnl/Hemi2/11754_TR4034_c0_g1_i1:83-2299(+)